MRLFLLLSLFFVSLTSHSEPIKVGTIGYPPYVIWKDGEVSGFSVGLWRIIAERLELETQFQHFDYIKQGLQALKDQNVDLLIGSVRVTPELAQDFAFTQPYHRVKLGAATLKKSLSYWQHIKNIIGENFFSYFAILILLFILFAFFIWIFERKSNNSQFRSNPKDGILEGAWFAISTVTTNGYADKVPVSWRGRILATCWIVIGALIYSSITASLTTFLTASESTNKTLIGDSLNGKKIIVPDQAMADLINEKFNTTHEKAHSMENSFSQLENDRVHSIIDDKALLRYYIQDHAETEAILLNTSLEGELYAFLFANFASKFYTKVNAEMIRAVSDNSLDRIRARWIE